MTSIKRIFSCRELFKNFMFPVFSEFLCIIICFRQYVKVSNKFGYMQYKYHIQYNLQVPTCNLGKYQAGVCRTGLQSSSSYNQMSQSLHETVLASNKRVSLTSLLLPVGNLPNSEILSYKLCKQQWGQFFHIIILV